MTINSGALAAHAKMAAVGTPDGSTWWFGRAGSSARTGTDARAGGLCARWSS